MAPRKELHYFDSARSPVAAPTTAGSSPAGPASRPSARPPPTTCSPTTPSTGWWPPCPDVRVVVSLREPVERAYSHYWARASRAMEDRPFAEVVADEQASRPPRVGLRHGRGPRPPAGSGPLPGPDHRGPDAPARGPAAGGAVRRRRAGPAADLRPHLHLHRRRSRHGARPRSAGRPTATAGSGPSGCGAGPCAPARRRPPTWSATSTAAPPPIPPLDPGPAPRAPGLVPPANQALAEWLGPRPVAWDGRVGTARLSPPSLGRIARARLDSRADSLTWGRAPTWLMTSAGGQGGQAAAHRQGPPVGVAVQEPGGVEVAGAGGVHHPAQHLGGHLHPLARRG